MGVSLAGTAVLAVLLFFVWRWASVRHSPKRPGKNPFQAVPYQAQPHISHSPMTSVVWASVHSAADRLSQQLRPGKRISTSSQENLVDVDLSENQELTVPAERTHESRRVHLPKLPTSPQATIVPEEYEHDDRSILVPTESFRSSYFPTRTPTTISKYKGSRSTTLDTLCGDGENPDAAPLMDPTLPPRLPSLAFSPSAFTFAGRVSRAPSTQQSSTGSRILPSGPREPRSKSIRKSSIQSTNPPTSFLHMSRSSGSTSDHTAPTSHPSNS